MCMNQINNNTNKINPPSAVLGGGGVHGKVCWRLIVYMSGKHNNV